MTATVDTPSPDMPSTGTTGSVHRTRRIVWVASMLVIALAGLWFGGRAMLDQFRPHLYSGTILQGAQPAPPLDALTLSNGEPADLSRFDGDVVVLYFGYTNCPDVCPTTLSDAASAIAAMPSSVADRVQLIMVSVDPARDELDMLGEYVGSFDPRFLGAGGDVADIDRTAAAYGVYYALGEGDVDSGYTVDHTASLIGIDPDGQLRIVWSPEVTRTQLTADLAALVD